MGRSSTARARLVDSARQLFHAGSYEAASVDDLCAAAGVNKGSFYHFFPAKRDLALAVLDAQWADARAKVLDPAFAPDVPPLDRISRFFARVAQVQRRPVVLGCPFGSLAVELATLEPTIRERVAEILDGYRGYFEAALSEAVAAGDAGPLDVAASSEALVAFLQGALLLARTRNDAAVVDRLGPRALALAGVCSSPTAVGEAR